MTDRRSVTTTGRERTLTTPRHLIPRVTAWTAVLAPLLLVGLGLLYANPDYRGLGLVLSVLVLIAALVLQLMVGGGWLLIPAVVIGIALLALSGSTVQFQVLYQSGVRTDAVVTAVHAVKGKKGTTYTCDIKRGDGVPLPHGELTGADCWAQMRVGETVGIVADPAGWVAPLSQDWAIDEAWIETAVEGGLAAVFGTLLGLSGWRGVRAARRGLRVR